MKAGPSQPRVHVSVVVAGRGRILMVKESKPDVLNQWNLPGGHMERGETAAAAAVREAHEETSLRVDPIDVVGVFFSPGAVRFVLRARVVSGSAAPRDDIVAIRWFTHAEFDAVDDTELVAPTVLRPVFERLAADTSFPLAMFVDTPNP